MLTCLSISAPTLDQAFYLTTTEAEAANGANPPLYPGAMASVPSICDAIAEGLDLNEAREAE